MTYLWVILAGLAGAAAGGLISALLVLGSGSLFGMTDYEGARGVLAAFGAAPVGAIIGLVVGIVLALRFQGKYSGFGTLAERYLMVICAIVGLAAIGTLARLYTLTDLQHPLPRVVFEIRLPPDAKVPDKQAVRITLETDVNQTDAQLEPEWLTQDSGRRVLHGFVDLSKRTTSRLLVLKIAGQADRLFQLKLWGDPGPTKAFTEWEQVEFISEKDGLRRAVDEDKYQFRFRVERGSKPATLQGDATGLGANK